MSSIILKLYQYIIWNYYNQDYYTLIIQNYIPWDNTVADSAVGVIVSAKFVLSVTTVTRCGGVQSGKNFFQSFLDNTPN